MLLEGKGSAEANQVDPFASSTSIWSNATAKNSTRGFQAALCLT